ncbi:myosin regulatory light chain LC-2, mantle muscle-like [Copidosoma floridanum]|uniref:myosin regulatory light chain LC-2, mantle muscle-like n=1 Tax=Copidosoma floridanum TaxID=29053 RepID=UPI0006C988DA|nr:myosin regulatory light chain LC-2, mantle muscle-like [Copidosoma floridanum]
MSAEENINTPAPGKDRKKSKESKKSAEEGSGGEHDTGEKSVSSGDDEVSLVDVVQQSFFKELMSKAERRTKELKLNMMSQLSEVFRLFDIDRDGVIGETDLKFTFSSLGETNVPEEKIKNMLNECPCPVDFEAFVGLFESKEMEFDSEIELIKAFAKWDSQYNGLIVEEKIKNDLMRRGDRFSEKDADRALEEAPIYDQAGDPSIDYIEFCANLCGFQNARNSELFQEKRSRSSFKN